ncbi:hypothetical protein DVH24_008743 [Malus domestica]|uniref:Uncharacterized protein n=1 Tax=Malus domestica TaxID=3750 RepID=A0A498JJY4_MALDO|nr:hypothetical protein DVH24_008743 [Malus domestica]
MKCSSEFSSKPDRKTVERNRRIQMKSLCFKLASLVPPQHLKTTNSKHDIVRFGPRPRPHGFVFGNSHENFPVGHLSWECSRPNSLNFGVPMEPEASKLPKGLDTVSQQNQLDTAASYIKQLRERIENLKERKEKAMWSQLGSSNSDVGAIAAENAVMTGSRLPVLELRDSGSCIESSVFLRNKAEVVSASFFTVGDKVFHSMHAQLDLEAYCSVVELCAGMMSLQDGKRVHSIVCDNGVEANGKLGAKFVFMYVKISRDGVDNSTVWQRLQDLLY